MLNPVVRNCDIIIDSNLFPLILWEWISILERENNQGSDISVKEQEEEQGMRNVWDIKQLL